jgi:hypothetical protein
MCTYAKLLRELNQATDELRQRQEAQRRLEEQAGAEAKTRSIWWDPLGREVIRWQVSPSRLRRIYFDVADLELRQKLIQGLCEIQRDWRVQTKLRVRFEEAQRVELAANVGKDRHLAMLVYALTPVVGWYFFATLGAILGAGIGIFAGLAHLGHVALARDRAVRVTPISLEMAEAEASRCGRLEDIFSQNEAATGVPSPDSFEAMSPDQIMHRLQTMVDELGNGQPSKP